MSYIHFKFVYKSTYDKIAFDGVNLNLSQLKKLIIEKSKLTQNTCISNAIRLWNKALPNVTTSVSVWGAKSEIKKYAKTLPI